jgi:hypothetical protein
LSDNFLTYIFLGDGLGVMDQFCGLWAHPILFCLISSCGGYIKDIVYKTPVTSLDELKLGIIAAIETIIPQMLENTCGKLNTALTYILYATNGAHVEVVQHSVVLVLRIIKLFELHFHILSADLFCCFWFENYRPWKPWQQFRITLCLCKLILGPATHYMELFCKQKLNTLCLCLLIVRKIIHTLRISFISQSAHSCIIQDYFWKMKT